MPNINSLATVEKLFITSDIFNFLFSFITFIVLIINIPKYTKYILKFQIYYIGNLTLFNILFET